MNASPVVADLIILIFNSLALNALVARSIDPRFVDFCLRNGIYPADHIERRGEDHRTDRDRFDLTAIGTEPRLPRGLFSRRLPCFDRHEP